MSLADLAVGKIAGLAIGPAGPSKNCKLTSYVLYFFKQI